jgi:hypothetical protein
MTRILFLSVFLIAALVGCRSSSTTLRFTDNRHAVAVTNPEKAKPGDKLEALVGTQKKIFFYLTRDASITTFHQSVDPQSGKKTLIASLLIASEPVRISIVKLNRPLAIVGPPTAKTKESVRTDPVISYLLGKEPTEIVGTGRGTWISTSSKRLFLRPIESDLIVVVETDGLDFAQTKDFILRMGSLSFEGR